MTIKHFCSFLSLLKAKWRRRRIANARLDKKPRRRVLNVRNCAVLKSETKQMRPYAPTLRNDGGNELLGVKRKKVFLALAHAHEEDGDFHLVADGDDDAALCRAVKFGEDDAVNVNGFLEDLHLRKYEDAIGVVALKRSLKAAVDEASQSDPALRAKLSAAYGLLEE